MAAPDPTQKASALTRLGQRLGTTLQAMVRGKAVPMQVQATPFVAPRYHRG